MREGQDEGEVWNPKSEFLNPKQIQTSKSKLKMIATIIVVIKNIPVINLAFLSVILSLTLCHSDPERSEGEKSHHPAYTEILQSPR